MIHIAIVEDDADSRDSLLALLLRYDKEGSFRILSFPDGESFLASCHNEQKYDLVFLDIGLPKKDGMQVAKEFRQVDEEAAIIFLTMLSQYAIEGYEVDALSYLVKPINYYEFAMKLGKAVRKVPFINSANIVLKTKSGDIRLSQADIRYVEISGHWVVYHTLGGDYSQYSSLAKVEEELSSPSFARCNSCYLVNLPYVQSTSGFSCILDNGTELKISQPKKKTFLAALEAYRNQERS